MIAPDLLLHGGKVITLDRGSHLAEAVAVRDGRIVSVGASAALLKEASPATRSVDLRVGRSFPGSLTAIPMWTVRGCARGVDFRSPG